MTKLTDYASNVYSQFGEDGIIEHIFEHVENRKFCVEFGASDDFDCSNVANLHRNKLWDALVIEVDPVRAETLTKKAGGGHCQVLCREVKPSGPDSIDQILGKQTVDLMSIDIDGNDIHVWRQMKTTTPRVICIEFNPTIPPHISVHQEYDPTPMGFGASLRALIDVGLQKGYTFIGATEINAFFVRDRFAIPFLELERNPEALFPIDKYTFLVTDFLGSAVAVGARNPWGIHLPYEGPTLAGNFFSITDNPKQTMDAYEGKYGRIVRWPQENRPNIADPDTVGNIPGGEMKPISPRNLLRGYLEAGMSPICIAIAHVSLEQVQWVYNTAAIHNYHCRPGGGILAVIRNKQ